MIEEFSFLSFLAVVALSIFISVSSSCSSLIQKPYIRISSNFSFNAEKNKWLLILIGFLFYFFLHSETVRDYVTYAEYYISRKNELYGESYGYFSSRDLLFFNYVEFLSSLGVSYRLAYGTIIGFYILALSKISEKHHVNIWMVFLLALVFGNIYFAVSGLRQTFAMAFILLAYSFYTEKRRLLAIIIVVLASGFHGSAFLGAMLIFLCVSISRFETIRYVLILLCLLSFPLLWAQMQGSSLVNIILPFFSSIIPDLYTHYVARIYAFDTIADSLGLGFAFFTVSKIFFLLIVFWLSLKNKIGKIDNVIITIALFYIFCFNVMGLNQYTHRLLNYLTPFFFVAMSIALTKISIQNVLFRLICVVYILASGLFAVIVAIR